MTRTARYRQFAALLIAAACVPTAALAAGPTVSSAPGRIVFAIAGQAVQSNVDAGGASSSVALPGGGALLLGGGDRSATRLYAAKIDVRGVLDQTFGSGGVASAETSANLLQVLRQPDGRLLLVGVVPATGPRFAPGRLQVTRLNADLTLDRSFGDGGVATTAISEGCGACTTAALQSDGSIVLVGTTGEVQPPPATPNLHWSLTRLTPAGAVDTSFGSGGIATIPTTVSTSGFNVAIGPGGTIITNAQQQGDLLSGNTKLLVTQLTATGAPDPSFAGGAPVSTPLSTGFLMVVLGDGSVVLQGQPQATMSGGLPPTTLSRQLLVRYTAVGAPAAGHGSGGTVDLGSASAPSQLLPAGATSVAVVGNPAYGLIPGSVPKPGNLDVRVVAANGTIGAPQRIVLLFGGGESSFLVSVRPRPVPSLSQNTFAGTRLLPRSDGSYLVVGGVTVRQPTGEGAGFSIGRSAVAALTPALALDASFGGPAQPLALSVRLSRQRARTALSRHGIRIELKSGAVGLARVKILHGGRAIAHSLLPVFGTSRRTIPVELTVYGNTYLRRHPRNLRVTITATGRDLLTSTKVATARGRLR